MITTLVLASWTYFTLPAVCESTIVTIDGRDSVVSTYILTDLDECYLWGRGCCYNTPILLAAKQVRGKEGLRDSLTFNWIDTTDTVIELYATTKRITGARSFPSNLVIWTNWKWDGYKWIRR